MPGLVRILAKKKPFIEDLMKGFLTFFAGGRHDRRRSNSTQLVHLGDLRSLQESDEA